MNRRGFLAAGCACGLLPFARGALGQGAAPGPWRMPDRFARPDIATDEGGIWALMDREETRLRRSPFALKDAGLQAYVQDIACKLGEGHCPDIRIHLVHTPYFNASMAPNGMMQVWTGLMLRVDNESQLAAVLGHEIGHYLQRHSLERLRDAKARSAAGQFLGLFGVVGAIGQLGMLAGMFAYGREHEREADSIGATLMHRAGYEVAEAAKVWDNLLNEVKARDNYDATRSGPLFATHPPSDERRDALLYLSKTLPGGASNARTWREKISPHVHGWLGDEVRRGQHEESIALLTRLSGRADMKGESLYARGEVRRMRGRAGDEDAAAEDFRAAIATDRVPAEAYRGLGLIYRKQGRNAEARAQLRRYLEAAPQAVDAGMVNSYLEEPET